MTQVAKKVIGMECFLPYAQTDCSHLGYLSAAMKWGTYRDLALTGRSCTQAFQAHSLGYTWPVVKTILANVSLSRLYKHLPKLCKVFMCIFHTISTLNLSL